MSVTLNTVTAPNKEMLLFQMLGGLFAKETKMKQSTVMSFLLRFQRGPHGLTLKHASFMRIRIRNPKTQR